MIWRLFQLKSFFPIHLQFWFDMIFMCSCAITLTSKTWKKMNQYIWCSISMPDERWEKSYANCVITIDILFRRAQQKQFWCHANAIASKNKDGYGETNHSKNENPAIITCVISWYHSVILIHVLLLKFWIFDSLNEFWFKFWSLKILMVMRNLITILNSDTFYKLTRSGVLFQWTQF